MPRTLEKTSLSLVALAFIGSCTTSESVDHPSSTHGARGVAIGRTSHAKSGPRDIVIDPRTPHIATYPCSTQCHADREPNPVPRKLVEFHGRIKLRHASSMSWCGSCHDLFDLDRLKMLDSERVSFDQSYRVCGQCHGEKIRDFRTGAHGISLGSWKGTTRRRSCTACHDPHQPGEITLEALPAPKLLRDDP